MLSEAERCRVLLVDDYADKLEAMRAILSDLGHEIITCTCGEDALSLLAQEDYAVVLLDVRMPVLDGFETAARIRMGARNADIPIIFITALNSSENHVMRGYSFGAVDYIFFPVMAEILRAKVLIFIERRPSDMSPTSNCDFRSCSIA
jgi:DNA-binding response OmpR family regulator